MLATSVVLLSSFAAPKDVIMIAVDDMRPELNCYGCEYMKTPNMNALAAESVTFDRMYTGLALCAPSRTIFLTTRRPDTSRVWTISPKQYWRVSGGNFTTLPQTFKERGYLTIGTGKIFHPGGPSNNSDAEYSWSHEALDMTIDGEPCPKLTCYINTFPEITEHNDSIYTSPAVHPQNCTPDASGEGLLANHMVSMLELIASKRKGGDKRPFFFAAGFHRPHIPWHAPQEFYDLYDLDMPLAPHPSPPTTSEGENCPNSLALNNNWVGKGFNYTFGNASFPIGQGYWTRSFKDIDAVAITKYMPQDGTGPPKIAQQKVRQAYRAALSFTDRNIGVMLDAAKAKGLYANAIVVLWADHGYQLGDNGQWGKHTDFEHATHIPFLVRLPPTSFPTFKGGTRSSAFLENVDLFPTLVELATDGPNVPLCPVDANKTRSIKLCTEGVSFVPLLMDLKTPWKSASFSQYHRLQWSGAPDPPVGASQGGEEEEIRGGEQLAFDRVLASASATGGPSAKNAMGYSIRTTGWRYTLWVPIDFTEAGYPSSMKWDSDRVQAELYEHADETKLCSWDFEHVNLAGDAAHAQIEATLRKQLIAGWRAAMPPSLSKTTATTLSTTKIETNMKTTTAAPPPPAVDPSTMTGKLLFGYQGWFDAPGSGSGRGWVHYTKGVPPNATNCTFDVWPAMDEYPEETRFPTTELVDRATGAPMSLFSSFSKSTQDVHFRWLREYGLDGVFLQRFVHELEVDAGDTTTTHHGIPTREFKDNITLHALRAAERNGRVVSIMYDISGATEEGWASTILKDWQHLQDLGVLKSPAWLHHDGKPTLSIWGIGFTAHPGTPASSLALLADLNKMLPITFIGGVPTHWRSSDGDSKPLYLPVYEQMNVLSPWLVGRFPDVAGFDKYMKSTFIGDAAHCAAKNISYAPVVWPGFSWENMMVTRGTSTKATKFNQIPRNGGKFWKHQASSFATKLGTKPLFIYGAMFDEIDEGTAMLKAAANEAATPAPPARFLHYSIDGIEMPSDAYLSIAGNFTQTWREMQGTEEDRRVVPVEEEEDAEWLRAAKQRAKEFTLQRLASRRSRRQHE